MSDNTPITGELREYATASWNPWPEARDRLHQMCDTIDAVHANLERENESLKAELDRVLGEQDHDGWVELPKDADGEVVHVGDMMERGKARGHVIALMLSEYPKEWGGALHWGIQLEGEQAPTALDAFFHHHHAPTVEDVLREFAEKVTDSQIPGVHPTYEEAIAEYATKLRLAGE